jgi:glycosyltransferase involved in cell wall biosynthesis
MEKTLCALQKQETGASYEIIVVDSSDDGTDLMIEEKFPDVRLFHLPEQTLPGSGRNLGVIKSKGAIVAFTDADCIPDPSWIERIIGRFKTTDCDGVGGSVRNGYPRSYVAWVSHLIEFNEWTPGRPAGWQKNNPSCNLAFKRDIFDRFGIEYTDNFPSEDTLFNWELTSRGGRLYYDPKINVVHLNRMKFRNLFRHQYRLGKAVAVERSLSGNPGKVFLKVKVLSLGLPFLRWIMAFLRLLKNDFKTALILIGIAPLFVPAAFSWTFGFMAGGSPRDASIRIHSI